MLWIKTASRARRDSGHPLSSASREISFSDLPSLGTGGRVSTASGRIVAVLLEMWQDHGASPGPSGLLCFKVLPGDRLWLGGGLLFRSWVAQSGKAWATRVWAMWAADTPLPSPWGHSLCTRDGLLFGVTACSLGAQSRECLCDKQEAARSLVVKELWVLVPCVYRVPVRFRGLGGWVKGESCLYL